MLNIKEAERIARAVRPDLQSCDEELHAFVFYTGDEFYGDMVVVLKEDGRVVDFYDGYIGVYELESKPSARYIIRKECVSVQRNKYSPADFGRWDTPPIGIRIVPSSLTPEHIAFIKEMNAQYAAKMEARKRKRQRHTAK